MSAAVSGPVLARRRFLFRVYLHGLVLLVLAGVAVFGVGRLIITPTLRRNTTPFTVWMVSRTAEFRADPGRLQAELERLKTELRVTMSIYDTSGALLGSNTDPPLPPPSAAEIVSLREDPLGQTDIHRRIITSFSEDGSTAGYAITTYPSFQFPLDRAALVFGLVLLVLALASIPLARSVVSPMEKLAAAARSLGTGNMRARTHLVRNDEIGDLARAFDDMAERVESLLLAEKELLANVSHELRTPLARIRVVLDLASEVDAERARRYLTEIAEDLAELERLVDDVLTAARLDLAEGRAMEAAPPLRLEPIDVHAIVEKAAKRFNDAPLERTLVVRCADGLPLVDADAAMLRRVLDNLLDNARKYSDAGSTIWMSARAEANRIVVEVSDNGIGIEADDIESAFMPFFRSDRSRARPGGGVGLGLTLARRIVRAHGGDIGLTSEVGVGTTVRFTVPTLDVPADAL